MNVLFLSDFEISPNAGGIERVVNSLADMFENHGINCFSAYCTHKGVGESANFRKTVCLNSKSLNSENRFDLLEKFLIDNSINVVIVTLLKKKNFIPLMPRLYDMTRKMNCKVVFTYHTMPGYELKNKISPSLAWYKFRHKAPVKELLPMLLVSFFDSLGLKKLLYPIVSRKLAYTLYSDLIVLLSDRFIDVFKTFVGETDVPITAIPNPLPYSENIDFEIDKKEKMVLSVGRFDLAAKRQDLLLEIWSEVEKDSRADDWSLVIVGYGDEEEYLKRYAEKLKLKSVTFTGFCNPEPYYEQASIYALTSAYEGFGVVLVEAEQYGVVPMAFDSYPAVHDVIENGKNGYVIPEKDKKGYVAKLLTLMSDSSIRNDMAAISIDLCQQFGKEKIANQWITVLDDVCSAKQGIM